MSNNNSYKPQRTNAITPWPSSTSMNYNGPVYFDSNNTSQPTKTYTVNTFTIGNRTYGGINVPVFTNVVPTKKNGKN
jgi:hypothetical protein